MLRDAFSALLDEQPAPASSAIWESSRFALDVSESSMGRSGGLSRATYELFAGMIEFGLFQGPASVVTVTDARIERILRRAGWPLVRLGVARTLGAAIALAGHLEISADSLAKVRARAGFSKPVLWRPALDMASATSGRSARTPDGHDVRAYDYTTGFGRANWSWGFLRRNPEFQAAMAKFLTYVASQRVAPNVTLYRRKHGAPSVADWGLVFRRFAA